MKSVFIYLLTVIATLTVADIYLAHTGAISLSEYEFEPETGLRYRDIEHLVRFNEGFSITSYNTSELYQHTPKAINTNNSFRIALIGDSYVKADQVFERQHFGQIMKKGLKLDQEINVVNYGYNGSDLQQMYITQKMIVNPTNPDLILYFLNTSDFVANKASDPLLPRLENLDDSLKVVHNYSENRIRNYEITGLLKQQSSIVNLIISGLNVYRVNGLLPALIGKFYQASSSSQENLSIDVPNPNKIEKQSFEISPFYEKILAGVDKEKVVFVFTKKDQYSEYIKAIIKAHHIKLIDLNPIFDRLKAEQIDPYYWETSGKYGHWNKKAHERIGIFLAAELNEILSTTAHR